MPIAESYLFRVERVKPHYGFGVNPVSSDISPYFEHHHTDIETVCLSPKRFEGRSTSFTLIADRHHTAEIAGNKSARKPIGIGALTMRGQKSNFLGSLPFDAALAIPGLIQSSGYRFIYLSGEPVRHGSATISHISFYHDFDLDEI